MSTAQGFIESISEETGVCWNESSIISILCDYIDNQQSFTAFEDYVRRRAEEELQECDTEES